MLLSKWKFSTDELVAKHGIVAATHQLAAEAGLEILQKGGNAIDAAVAGAFAASILEPFMSGVGGGGHMVVHLAERGETVVIDFGMQVPAAARADMFEQELEPAPAPDPYTFRLVKGNVNVHSYLATCVPGEIAGLCTALERYGTKSRREVMAPAIRLAAEGYPMHWFLALLIHNHRERILRYPETAAVFLKDDGNYRAALLSDDAELVVQPDLARTLEAVAEEGPGVFYQGEIAHKMVDFVQSRGGILTMADLAGYSPRTVAPLQVGYRSVDVAVVPHICAGTTVVQMLNLLEQFDLAALGYNSADALHVTAECSRRAHVDRYVYLGDPEYAEVPYEGLISKEYARVRAAEISMDRATPDVGPGDPWSYSGMAKPAGWTEGRVGEGDGNTSHITAADEAHNLVSITKTHSDFMVPGTGVMMGVGLNWFDPEPGRPNSIAGGKRPLTNMSPMILLRDGRPFAALGAPGARRIANAVAGVTSNLADYQMGIRDAISAPRLDCSTPRTLVDDRIPAEVRAELSRRGHRIRSCTEDMGHMNFARPNGIVVDEENGCLRASSYPFFHGAAAGF